MIARFLATERTSLGRSGSQEESMAPGGTHVSVCGALGPPWGPFFAFFGDPQPFVRGGRTGRKYRRLSSSFTPT